MAPARVTEVSPSRRGLKHLVEAQNGVFVLRHRGVPLAKGTETSL